MSATPKCRDCGNTSYHFSLLTRTEYCERCGSERDDRPPRMEITITDTPEVRALLGVMAAQLREAPKGGTAGETMRTVADAIDGALR